jgi:redox-sensitive bicupin YhaK (pirin superfamily)
MNSILHFEKLSFPWATKDPFLFCAYHKDNYPKGNSSFGVPDELKRGRSIGNDFTIKDGFRMYHGKTVPGFPYHPHRGFETITINKQGIVDHSDSLGGAGRFRAGDVQWMTAGKGIQHSELFPLLNTDKDNTLEIFQIWLNLPKANKMVEPYFKMLWKEDVPIVEEYDENGKLVTIDIITGSYKSKTNASPAPDSWAAIESNKIAVLTVKMEPGAVWTIPAIAQSEIHGSIYYYQGESIAIDEQKYLSNTRLDLNPMQDVKVTNGNKTSYFLFLQGKPLKEPVVQHGPFVMNTQAEIREAIMEYQETEFGGWPWPEKEQVHSPSKGRFAIYSNGTEENKD